MKHSSLAFASALAASLLVACMSPVIGEKTATIVIATAPSPGSRALTETWPMGGLPVFSDITVSVLDSKGNEMLLPKEPVVSGNSITVTVTAGKDMTLVVDAKPDWDATEAKYGEILVDDYPYGYPKLVTMYSGRNTFSVGAGETASVNITLATGGTKILLPNPSNGEWTFGIADNFLAEINTANSVNVVYNSYFTYDKYGFLYVSNGSYVNVYGDVGLDSMESINFGNTIFDIAISESDNRLYGYFDYGEGCDLYYVNLDNTSAIESVNDPSLSMESGGVAVDSSGFVYIPATYSFPDESSVSGIFKLSISGNTLMVVGYNSYEDLGLGLIVSDGSGGTQSVFYRIEDMIIRDSILYLATSDVYADDNVSIDPPRSRGKVVAINTATLSVQWQTGETDSFHTVTDPENGDSQFYGPLTPASQFYGPRRFVAIAPKKLYIADDGFSWDGTRYTGNAFTNVNRIIEIDTEGKSISAIGLDGASEFIENFANFTVC